MLSKKYEVTVNTIKNRINNLIQNNIILGFTIYLNPILFNINEAICLIRSTEKLAEEKIEKIGSHRLVSAIGIGIDSGFIIFSYTSHKELNSFSDFLDEQGFNDFIVYPILLPTQVDQPQPLLQIEDLKPIDFLILYHLKDNGRMALNLLAKQTQLSVPTIRKRLQFLRINNMIKETIKLNPGTLSKGMMIIIEIKMKKLTSKNRVEIEDDLRNRFNEKFWVSWKVVGRPILLIAFQITNTEEIQKIKQELINNIISDVEDIRIIIGGSLNYYPDFREEIFENEMKNKWFSEKQWSKI